MLEPGREEKIEFGLAVLYVMRKRADLGSILIPGHRECVESRPTKDSTDLTVAMEVELDDVGTSAETETQREALLELVRGTLFCWYKVPPELKSLISREFLMRSLHRGIDAFSAQFCFEDITSAAQCGITVMNERQARSDAANRAKRAKRDALDLEKELAARRSEYL